MLNRGLFVGLVTLDLIYLVNQVPERNQKIVALDYMVAAGGPATNAAVTFSHLGRFAGGEGDRATLLGAIGAHPMSHLICTELQPWGVAIADLAPTSLHTPAVSSILVTQGTGERAVISLNAVKQQGDIQAIPGDILQGIEVVLIDGHQMAVGTEIAQRANRLSIPVVIDGGSWKPGFERVLSLANYAICSANFHPPGTRTTAEAIAFLQALGIPHIAITHGAQPIEYISQGLTGQIPVPNIQAIDTLGAGDIFHGAFCHYIQTANFPNALSHAALVAAHACQFFGTRRWMKST